MNIPLRFFPSNFESEMSRESGKGFQRKCLLSWHLSRDSHGASLGETTVFDANLGFALLLRFARLISLRLKGQLIDDFSRTV